MISIILKLLKVVLLSWLEIRRTGHPWQIKRHTIQSVGQKLVFTQWSWTHRVWLQLPDEWLAWWLLRSFEEVWLRLSCSLSAPVVRVRTKAWIHLPQSTGCNRFTGSRATHMVLRGCLGWHQTWGTKTVCCVELYKQHYYISDWKMC